MKPWRIGSVALHSLWLWAPVASGAYRGWPFAVALGLVSVALAAWLAEMLVARRFEWRRTSLDLPLALLGGLVVFQLVLGNRPLVEWALGPPAPLRDLHAALPSPFLLVGTASPAQTARSLLLFAAYAAVYYLVVNYVRTRRDIERVLRTLVVGGSLLAALGLIDYLSGYAWLLPWRTDPYGGRLSGTFANPDHFAAWLVMLTMLGLGWQMSRVSESPRTPPLARLLAVRELREEVVRRYLPLVAVGILTIAAVFTLSRGGVVGLASGLLALLALFGLRGRLRRGLVLTGALVLVVLAYASWIGLAPLFARIGVTPASAVDRWTQYAASLAMLRDFPVFGVGFGAYRDVYFRYQPLAHRPHEVYYPYAHNDLLQFAVETGALGAALAALAFWRVLADLVGAHILGRGRCPVSADDLGVERRSDRYSLAIGFGALAGLVAITAHSGLDFSMRIPANGFLAATLLGLATTVLHTRLRPGREELISRRYELRVAGRSWLAVGVPCVVVTALVIGWGFLGARAGLVDARVDELGRPASLVDAEAILAVDPRHVTALQRRAHAQQQRAVAAWTRGLPAASRTPTVRALLAQARRDLHTALTASPTDPFIHIQLAWLEAIDAEIAHRVDPGALSTALGHAARALALAPENPRIYESVARLAVGRPDLGVRAAREAVRRDPALLGGLVEAYHAVGLTEAEWLALVPDSPVDRLDLAVNLEARRLAAESLAVYRAASEIAPEAERPLYRWMLAQALARRGHAQAARAELERALAADPTNPELRRALGELLAQRGDPAALDSLRGAVAAAQQWSRASAAWHGPFPVGSSRLSSLVAGLANDLSGLARYRRALARHLIERALWDQAANELTEITRELPTDAEARFLLGVALDGMGVGAQAFEQYRRAVELAPRTTRFRTKLARHLWEHERYFEAIDEWRTVKEQAPGDIDTRLALARALEKVGDRIGAFRGYREVLELRPGHPDAARALARLRGKTSPAAGDSR
mgnify:CR=1 FL=1